MKKIQLILFAVLFAGSATAQSNRLINLSDTARYVRIYTRPQYEVRTLLINRTTTGKLEFKADTLSVINYLLDKIGYDNCIKNISNGTLFDDSEAIGMLKMFSDRLDSTTNKYKFTSY